MRLVWGVINRYPLALSTPTLLHWQQKLLIPEPKIMHAKLNPLIIDAKTDTSKHAGMAQSVTE